MAIKAAKLRGVESFGMLCSAKELGIDADASGLLELPLRCAGRPPLAAYLGLPDASIELEAHAEPRRLPGRASGSRTMSRPLFGSAVNVPSQAAAAVAQRCDAAASRSKPATDARAICGRIIEGIDPAARTPLWMAERLRRAGMRPISAVVDVTNYVMLELGQPMHAFDNDTLQGDIVVRHARAGETLKLLDGSEAKLDRRLRADRRCSTRRWRWRGVMGGFDSRVTDATRNMFLEAAHFAPAAIMGRARKLGMHTDAAHRFERGVDPELPRRALERATELLLSIAGGKAGPVLVADDLPQICRSRAAVVLRRARLARVLGMDVADAEVARIFTRARHAGRSACRWLAGHRAQPSLRHRARGRPDRGGRAHPRLRQHSHASRRPARWRWRSSRKRASTNWRCASSWPRAVTTRR